jgi:hypothetical protein
MLQPHDGAVWYTLLGLTMPSHFALDLLCLACLAWLVAWLSCLPCRNWCNVVTCVSVIIIEARHSGHWLTGAGSGSSEPL